MRSLWFDRDFDTFHLFTIFFFFFSFSSIFRQEVQLFRSKNVSLTQIMSHREPAASIDSKRPSESDRRYEAKTKDSHSSAAERAPKRNALFHSNQSKLLSAKIISWWDNCIRLDARTRVSFNIFCNSQHLRRNGKRSQCSRDSESKHRLGWDTICSRLLSNGIEHQFVNQERSSVTHDSRAGGLHVEGWSVKLFSCRLNSYKINWIEYAKGLAFLFSTRKSST